MENENYTGPMGDAAIATSPVSDEKKAASPDSLAMALTDDASKVKFTNSNSYPVEGSRNGDAKVDIENVPVAFAGMGKDELMKFANDPFWVRLRWALFFLFWLSWLAMLAGAIGIIVLAPRCAPVPTLDWWQKTVIYQIYPRSFQDSNGDGVGDLKGIENRLDYLKGLGVSTVWLSPFYKSPMKDFGYDVENFTDIDPTFGTMTDFEELTEKMAENDIKLVLDLIPGHTSDTSKWFEKSRNKEEPYTNYYVWKEGEKGTPPNNWISVFGGSAWTYDEVRQEYYLHQFLPSQPDLNLREEKVRAELEEVMKFWLDKGVSGFRVDAVSHLFEDIDLQNEPASGKSTDAEAYESLDHIYTKGQMETLGLLAEWRSMLDKYSEEKDREHILLMLEATDPLNHTMKYFGNGTEYKLADFPFNFDLPALLNQDTHAKNVSDIVRTWLEKLPPHGWPNWLLGNHDMSRISSRVDPELLDGLHMITILMRGTPITYYGEEIGMQNVEISFNETQDPFGKRWGAEKYMKYSRDPERSPMQWNKEANAGFTTGNKTWLPLHPNYTNINVKVEEDNINSHLHVYKKLVKLRNEPAIQLGSIGFLDVGEDVFAFSRVKRGSPGYVILVNFNKENSTVVNLNAIEKVKPPTFAGDNVLSEVTYKFPEAGTVEVDSGNVPSSSAIYVADGKNKVQLNKLPLGPREAVVLKFVPAFL